MAKVDNIQEQMENIRGEMKIKINNQKGTNNNTVIKIKLSVSLSIDSTIPRKESVILKIGQ